MNILFRVDCNQEVGFGHMSRCNLIAKYMSSKLNSNIFFLSRNYNCQNFLEMGLINVSCVLKDMLPKKT